MVGSYRSWRDTSREQLPPAEQPESAVHDAEVLDLSEHSTRVKYWTIGQSFSPRHNSRTSFAWSWRSLLLPITLWGLAVSTTRLRSSGRCPSTGSLELVVTDCGECCP